MSGKDLTASLLGKAKSKKLDFSLVFKANPYHDKAGRFTTHGGANFMSSWGKEYAIAAMKASPKQTKSFTDVYSGIGSSEHYKAFVDEKKAYLDSISRDTLKAINNYTGNDYRSINSVLRSNEDLSKSHVRMAVAELDAAIAGSTVGVDTKAYRGIRNNSEHATTLHNMFSSGKIKPGTVFTESAFSSTSLDKGLAKNWSGDGGVVFHMNIPKEAKGVYVGMKGQTKMTRNKYSQFPQERELIMHRKGSVIVKKAWKDKDGTLNVEVDWHVPVDESHPANGKPAKRKKKKGLNAIFEY